MGESDDIYQRFQDIAITATDKKISKKIKTPCMLTYQNEYGVEQYCSIRFKEAGVSSCGKLIEPY